MDYGVRACLRRCEIPRRAKNQTLATEFLATLPVVGLDLPAAERFGLLKAELELGGNILADADLMIAAIPKREARVW